VTPTSHKVGVLIGVALVAAVVGLFIASCFYLSVELVKVALAS
jgi:hypothetical protein